MEKLKYFAMALLVAVSAGFVSCSDDDDNGGAGGNAPGSSIVGTWEGHNYNYTERIVFTAEGGYMSVTTFDDPSTSSQSESGTYTADGKNLTIYTDSGWGYPYVDEYEYAIEGDRLTLYEPGSTYVYYRQ